MYASRDKTDPISPVRKSALGRYADTVQASERHYESARSLGFAPLIATTAAPVLKSIVSKVGISFATPSDKRAAAVLGRVVAAANGGNLNAVAIMDARQNIGIAAERAVWAGGFRQVSPQVLSVYAPHRTDLIAAIPESAQSSPESAASWALQSPVTVPPSVLQQVADTVVPAFLNTQAGRQIKAAAVQAAVTSTADQAGDTLKKYALPAAILLGLFFFSRGRR